MRDTIQGQQNQLPHPVYLPPVHIENTKIVGGDKDVTLTVPGFEGYKLIVKANSVTFPDGTRQGELVASPVYNDRLPMVPPGTGGSFMASGWTLQPSGTRFDPPIEVHIPNSDGARPGTVLPVVQWDHDMAFFVPMGLGTISEDGSELVTQPHFGMSKAGWHGGLNPNSSNNAQNSSSSVGSGCFAKILANNEDELWLLEKEGGTDVDFEVEFNQECGNNDWTYDWRFYYGRDLSQYVADPSNEATPTVQYERPNGEPYLVSLVMQCIGCNSLTVILDTRVFVYTPDIVIKRAEENPFELIDRGGAGTSYYEKTNLIVEAQYPNGHPNAHQVITDFTGSVKISENEETNYYNDAVFNTYLPVDIEFVNGKIEKSLNSVSNVIHPRISQPKPATIEIEVAKLENPGFGSIMTVEVEQWVLSSDLTFNGMNDPSIPDWFEKAIWTIIGQFRSNPDSEIAREVIFGVGGIEAARERIEIVSTCAYVSSINYDKLNFKTSCYDLPDIFRLNNGKNLEMIVMHESRHVWQNIQTRLEPAGVIRIGDEEFANDSDGDRCPEIVAAGSESGVDDNTPLLDGTGNTEGPKPDNIPDNHGSQETFNECLNLREADAVEFGVMHD